MLGTFKEYEQGAFIELISPNAMLVVRSEFAIFRAYLTLKIPDPESPEPVSSDSRHRWVHLDPPVFEVNVLISDPSLFVTPPSPANMT